MSKASVLFELKGTNLTLAGVEQVVETMQRSVGKMLSDVQQVHLRTVTFDTKGTRIVDEA